MTSLLWTPYIGFHISRPILIVNCVQWSVPHSPPWSLLGWSSFALDFSLNTIHTYIRNLRTAYVLCRDPPNWIAGYTSCQLSSVECHSFSVMVPSLPCGVVLCPSHTHSYSIVTLTPLLLGDFIASTGWSLLFPKSYCHLTSFISI